MSAIIFYALLILDANNSVSQAAIFADREVCEEARLDAAATLRKMGVPLTVTPCLTITVPAKA